MSSQRKAMKETLPDQPRRLDKARKSFDQLQAEIAPYVKKRQTKDFSTHGKWCQSSSLIPTFQPGQP